MNNNTKGAWLVHHAEKIKKYPGADSEFEQINFAGKCGILLSCISSNSQQILTEERISNLSKAAGINRRTELPLILEELKKQQVIEQSKTLNKYEILGIPNSITILNHVSRIFDESEPSNSENAAVELSELCSESPINEKNAKTMIEDTFELANSDSENLLRNCQLVGFIDSEEAFSGEKLLFNGNLFRTDDVNKSYAILNSLNDRDAEKTKEFNLLLSKSGCIDIATANTILGVELLKKLHSIGVLDINQIGNEYGTHYYITKPSAFNKFSSSAIDDAFDLAKAFVTSLTFGMQKSATSRGRITMIEALLRKLINGYEVGPATAIGHDYQILELKGVIKITESGKQGQYYMSLLKKDIGEMALKVITSGDASLQSLNTLPSATVTSYISPEGTRTLERINQPEPLKRNIGEILSQLRKGN
ncbi:TPA: hypothetical protein ACNEIF_003853 [Escherichia coli]|uniref:hypothetical protein n=1 Tax=Escherichia coli TaxID=562 RepID=UPI000578EEFC|nr:hypothetical protein [Escherichia coli]EKV4606497.1 hypothetical protein [Escherichia coli]EMC2032378.1 hypothetical protein [Escherichia coli]MBS9682045.1 hypothetical protein [Escherichia coli]MCN6550581.1 hypothetical protein [Escherichia coli]MDF6372664.1 hypothetical protein [Escherichia coli]